MSVPGTTRNADSTQAGAQYMHPLPTPISLKFHNLGCKAMSERESVLRATVIIYFPMFIAALSLITSMYNNYLNSKALDVVQHSLGRGEYLRTCRDIIEAYFQVKFRVGLLAPGANPTSGIPTSARADAENSVNKFAALGTYLANLGDERAREQYTHLSWELEKIAREAGKTPGIDEQKRFELSDQMFAGLNTNCVRMAQQ
jgi:hypothetical protein